MGGRSGKDLQKQTKWSVYWNPGIQKKQIPSKFSYRIQALGGFFVFKPYTGLVVAGQQLSGRAGSCLGSSVFPMGG